jgi:hypothetical protein
MTPRAFDLAQFKSRYRALCAQWDVDPLEGATGYQLVHIKVAQKQAAAPPQPETKVTITRSELYGLIAHAPVLPDTEYARRPTFATSYGEKAAVWEQIAQGRRIGRKALLAIRDERLALLVKRRTRNMFTSALVVALLEAEARDAMLRALLRTLPLRERHKRRGFTLRWVPDGAGGLVRVETALQMAGD